LLIVADVVAVFAIAVFPLLKKYVMLATDAARGHVKVMLVDVE
jgi:hypothetical protein